MKRDKRARLQLAEVISLDSRRTTSSFVHREQLISGQLYVFPTHRLDQRLPGRRWNALTFPPFFDRVLPPPHFGGQLRESAPTVKDIVKRAHVVQHTSDRLSDQVPPMIPMTVLRSTGTISPMGRATTPVKFRAEMAKRLMSARIMAGFETKRQAADALQIGLDRYEKWESGRTPVPAQYVGAICELFSIDANYLFGVGQPLAQRKAVSA